MAERLSISINLANKSLFEKIAALRQRDGRHLVVKGDDGISLYVTIKNGEIVGYENEDAEGQRVVGFIMKRIIAPSANDPADFCLHCHYKGGHPTCYAIPCPAG